MSVSLRRDVLVLACAISAGIHGALAPEHFREGAAAGGGFVAAAVVLALLAVVLTRRPDSQLLVAAAALTFGGLIASYLLATTSGLPLLHPEPEPVDALALATKLVEAIGLVTSLTLLWRAHAVALGQRQTHPQTKGTTA